MQHRRRNSAPRRTRHSWTRRILCHARAIYEDRRRFLTGLLNHFTGFVRGGYGISEDYPTRQGQRLLSHDFGWKQVRFDERKTGDKDGYVEIMPLRRRSTTNTQTRGRENGTSMGLPVYRDIRKVAVECRRRLLRNCTRNQEIQQRDDRNDEWRQQKRTDTKDGT